MLLTCISGPSRSDPTCWHALTFATGGTGGAAALTSIPLFSNVRPPSRVCDGQGCRASGDVSIIAGHKWWCGCGALVGSHGHGVARRDVSECVLHDGTFCQ